MLAMFYDDDAVHLFEMRAEITLRKLLDCCKLVWN